MLSNICKLDFYCFEQIFEWLSLRDLKNLRQTCKLNKQILDDYLKMKYSMNFRVQKCRMAQLNRMNSVGFEFVNRMVFLGEGLNVARFEEMKAILNHIESIEFICPFLNGDFYEDLLKYCTQLKHLMIRNCCEESAVIIGNNNEWLNRCYPTLEHIGFDCTSQFFVRTELKSFFERNPTIRTFSIGFDFIWENQKWMLESNIRLDQLDVFNYYVSYRHNVNSFDSVCDLLNKLHQRGFYQRLFLYIDQCERQVVTQINSLCALERLALDFFDINWSFLPPLHKLKEFYFYRPNLEIPAMPMNSLINIKRIDVYEASFDMIIPFIRCCIKLKQVKIKRLRSGNYTKNDIIDLVGLNRERKKLLNARKIAIFVEEDIFLKNKWNQEINLSFIALKRKASCDKIYLFHEW